MTVVLLHHREIRVKKVSLLLLLVVHHLLPEHLHSLLLQLKYVQTDQLRQTQRPVCPEENHKKMLRVNLKLNLPRKTRRKKKKGRKKNKNELRRNVKSGKKWERSIKGKEAKYFKLFKFWCDLTLCLPQILYTILQSRRSLFLTVFLIVYNKLTN